VPDSYTTILSPAAPVQTLVAGSTQSVTNVVSNSGFATLLPAAEQFSTALVAGQGPPGPSGAAGSPTFETVSQNLEALPKSITYSQGLVATIVYAAAGGPITKTFNYTLGNLTSLVLSGNVPGGVALTKTLTYSSNDLVGVSYS
jgi:hypothetical protein